MQLRSLRIDLHGEVRGVRVFGSENAAATHVRRHYWKPSEKWSELEDLFPTGRPYDGSDLQRAYDGYCAHIERVIRAGLALPLHLHTLYVRPGGGSARPSVIFVGPCGTRVAVCDGVVRTAFRTRSARNHGLFSRFAVALMQAAASADRGLYREHRSERGVFSELRRTCAPETWDWQCWTLQTFKQWVEELR